MICQDYAGYDTPWVQAATLGPSMTRFPSKETVQEHDPEGTTWLSNVINKCQYILPLLPGLIAILCLPFITEYAFYMFWICILFSIVAHATNRTRIGHG